ncbi:MAG TPA: helicase C-terminal domain-containing protein, partial [Pseudomonadales bacterium]|nr:helicase C-terminal domain-containing protein [Pseudomonadales bacterium]
VLYLQEHAGSKKLAELQSIVDSIRAIAGKPRTDEHVLMARAFFAEVRSVTNGKAKWQIEFKQQFPNLLNYYPDVCVNSSPVRQSPQIIVSQMYVNVVVGQYLCNAHHSVLVSGSLSIKNDISGMLWAVSSLRLEGKTGVMAQFSPTSFGTLTFNLASADETYPEVYVGKGDLSKRWLARVATDIQELAKGQNIVVLTGAHHESAVLENVLLAAGEKRIISRHQSGESIRQAAEQFMSVGGIFITAAGHTGLNLVQGDGTLAFSDLVITRIGMAPRDDDRARFVAALRCDGENSHDMPRLKAKILRQEYSRNIVRSVRRIRQSIGRAIRSSDHKANIIICDPRFPRFEDRDIKLTMLREAIPMRFYDAYKAASTSNHAEEVLF